MEFYTELLDNYKVVKKRHIAGNTYHYRHIDNMESNILLTYDDNVGYSINFVTGIDFLDKNTLFFRGSVKLEYINFFIKTLLISMNIEKGTQLCSLKDGTKISSDELIIADSVEELGWSLLIGPIYNANEFVSMNFHICKSEKKLEHTLSIMACKSIIDSKEISLDELRDNVY